MGETGINVVDFLSNEPIEGELLADRLTAGSLDAADALAIALGLGTQLGRAHSTGRRHGYLSPYSVAIASDGVHVLQPRPLDGQRALPYRSPEQVRGEEADCRSDIFSFGAILYELASGHRAFPGEGADLNEAILDASPAPLEPGNPIGPAMEGVIEACIQKDPGARRQRIQNAVTELKLAARSVPRAAIVRHTPPRPPARPKPVVEAAPAPPPLPARMLEPEFEAPAAYFAPEQTPAPAPSEFRAPRRRLPMAFFSKRRFLAIGLAVLALAATGLAAVLIFHKAPGPVLRFSVAPPEHTTYPGTPAVSPNGMYLVFSAIGPEGHRMLWLRAFDEVHAKLIPGTEGGFAPFWSPDSMDVAFFTGKSLMKVRVNAQTEVKPQLLCGAESAPGGGTWNKDGVILFAPSLTSGLYRVASTGGNPAPVLPLNTAQGERGHIWPQFLPDDKHFVYYGVTNKGETATGIYTASLDTTEKPKFLFASQTNAIFSTLAGGSSSAAGYLLYMKDRNLMGQSFNSSKLTMSGDVITLATDIGAIETLSLAPISVSRNAVLVYQAVGKATRQLVWMDRSGKTIGTVGDPGEWGPPRIAPDGIRIAAGKLGDDGKNADIWIFNRDNPPIPFEVKTGFSAGSPVWSPDGTRIAFWETRNNGVYDIFVKPVNGNGKPELLYKSPYLKYPTDWSRDGRALIFGEYTPETKSDIWSIGPVDRHVGPALNTVHSEGYAVLSPDGKWLAYQTDDSGFFEVAVQPWEGGTPGTKRIYKISDAGGGLPHWRSDGGELFYINGAGTMMSVQVHADASGFRFDPPRPLFDTRLVPKTWNWFDVSPDGQRFLMNVPLEWSNASLITVMTNWTEKLKE